MNIVKELAPREENKRCSCMEKRDRFARDEVSAILLEKEFSKLGVRLFSVKEGEFSVGHKNRIVNAIERVIPEETAKSLKENMRVKRYAYVDAGSSPIAGMALFGYAKVGKRATTRYEINDSEADIVRDIFALYHSAYHSQI